MIEAGRHVLRLQNSSALPLLDSPLAETPGPSSSDLAPPPFFLQSRRESVCVRVCQSALQTPPPCVSAPERLESRAPSASVSWEPDAAQESSSR